MDAKRSFPCRNVSELDESVQTCFLGVEGKSSPQLSETLPAVFELDVTWAHHIEH